MLEKLTTWWCRRAHKGIVWKKGGYECAVCWRFYPIANDLPPPRQREETGIDRHFAEDGDVAMLLEESEVKDRGH